ncbi:SDR family NAD(P)-dependent oxidoreductase [Arthrobacter sp. ISL-5]|uniref:SDR family NAD(P)-dependent oxidoreductase n=1 Tax=Arthrobacter sp. ISL-5 TaxID=2819111 RepID=UPI001BE674DE|nr:SDR family oxidoreductase [Arthrobacter sp. ISL-5]MBT2554171.1 SDR family oxidoreductase [Arthrobacter sp. ISL-5]
MSPARIHKPLSETSVLIAGGSSGIGFASALAFVDAGVPQIVLLSKNEERGEFARDQVQRRSNRTKVTFIPCDATNPEEVSRAVAKAHSEMGAIDALVTSVSAPSVPELLHRTKLADIPDMLALQALPPMLLTRAVFPIMEASGGGSIVNVASDAAKLATPGESVLGGAMAAIVMFSRVAAIEGKRHGIRVNTLTPSLLTDTATTARATESGFSKKLFEKAALLADLGVPESADQAELVVFLSSPAAARLTGQAISVNGGISAA